MLRSRVLLWLTVAVALRSANAWSMTLVIAPIVSISPDIPHHISNRLHEIITDEVTSNSKLKIAKLASIARDEAAETALQTARAEFTEAKAATELRQFRIAEQKLTRSIDFFKAAAAAQDSVEELAGALELLATAHYALGQDDAGAAALTQTFALAPSRRIEATRRSPLFAQVVESLRRQSGTQPRGALQFDTTPSALPIEIDGIPQGSSPLLIRGLAPGHHLYRIRLPHRQPMAGVATVVGKSVERISVAMPDALAVDRLVIQLASNSIDTVVLASAKAMALEARADALLIAGLIKTSEGLALHSCWYDLQSETVRRLAPVRFDAELLSARLKLAPWAQTLDVSNVAQLSAIAIPGRLVESFAGGTTAENRSIDFKGIAKPTENSPRRRVPLKKIDSHVGLESP